MHLKRDYSLLRQKTDLPSYYCREMSWKVKVDNDAPVGVPKDAMRLYRGNKYVPWFVSIPTLQGRICLPLRMSKDHSRLLGECDLCDSRLIKRNHEFYLHIVITKEVTPPVIPSHAPVLALDLGERVIAPSVVIVNDKISSPGFLGREVRSIRRHYGWLRKRLGRKKLVQVIKGIGQTEHRKVNTRLHVIASSIVRQAEEMGALIAIGDLTGIRHQPSRGKRVNRIVNTMPFNQLTTHIMNKAAWAGVPVIEINEAYTSRECRICSNEGKRPSQGRFMCPSCGEYNADLNGAVNIGNRALAYMAIAGVSGVAPLRES